MKQLFRLIFKEILGPWLFGVAIFTVLIMAGSFLFKFTEYLVSGIEFLTILKLTVLMLPAVMAKTFSMAMLLAALLAFGRLSSDSEVVALRAAGASIGRIMRPVTVFGLAVALLTFWFNEQVVPAASKQATTLNSEIAKAAKRTVLGATAIAVQEGKGVILISATEFRAASGTLINAQITSLREEVNPETESLEMRPKATLYAKELEYRGENDWRIRGGGRLVSTDGTMVLELKSDVWPGAMPKLKLSVEDIIAQSLKDLDTYNMAETRRRIETLKRAPRPNRSQIANLEYGYYNKISVPLAALVFGLVGAPLGIRNHRTGAASGFWLSVMIIFAYMMLANFMAVWAQGGVLPAYLASFTPLAIGLIVAAVTIHKKN
jgi:lipopolysaccharide export system permease protein